MLSCRMATEDVRPTTNFSEFNPRSPKRHDNDTSTKINSMCTPSMQVPTDAPPPYTNPPPAPPLLPPSPPLVVQQQQHNESRLDDMDDLVSKQSDERTDRGAPQFAVSRSGPLFTSIKELVDIHDKVMDLRIGMDIHENNYNAQWRHTSNHLDNFLKEASAFMSSVTEASENRNVQGIKDTWDRLQSSVGHLQRWQTKGKHHQQDLTKWEGMLCEKEEHVYGQLRQIMAEPAVSSSPSLYSSHNMAFESVAVSDASSDGMEHKYYDKLGDLGLQRDRIFNFDADQRLRKQRLELAIKKQDFATALREQQSFKEYVDKRQELLQEYFNIKQELEDLGQDCKAAGIAVEVPAVTSFLDLSYQAERLPMTVPSRAPRISLKWNPDLFLLFGGLDKRNRILQWRDEVRKAQGTSAIVMASVEPIDDTPPAGKDGDIIQEQQLGTVLEPSPKATLDPAAADAGEAEEEPLVFNRMDEENPTSRRYSEPDVSELWRRMVLPTQMLMNTVTSKSEGGVEIVDIPPPEGDGLQSDIARPTPSERRRLRPKKR